MSDRRALHTAAGIYLVLWLAGMVAAPAVVPCDSQNAVWAQEPPAPAPEPQPAPEVTVSFRLPAELRPGTLIPVVLETNGEKVNVDWQFDGGFDTAHIMHAGETGVIITHNAGLYSLAVFGTIDGKPVLHSETLKIGDPLPPEPPKPLAELVAPFAEALAKAYRDLAAQVYASVAQFQATHDALLANDNVTLSPEATAELQKRLADSLAEPLDSAKLSATLRGVADELAKPGPTPPPVTVGKRAVVILRETDDNTPAIGLLTTQLRTGEAAAYLKSKGHTLDILDDDNPAPIVTKLVALGVAEPALFILDAATGAVVHQQPLPASAAEVLAVLKAHGG